MLTEFPTASIHGRFQILHLDHLDYFQRAADRYGRLYIGLTGLRHDLVGGAGRRSPAANPLTYWERVEMWRRVLLELGHHVDDHLIGPFPIEAPIFLGDFVPKDCICATTVREPWNEEKVRLLERLGYQVDDLKCSTEKTVSSTMIRSMIADGSLDWKDLVPRSVADFLVSIDLRSRLEGCSSER